MFPEYSLRFPGEGVRHLHFFPWSGKQDPELVLPFAAWGETRLSHGDLDSEEAAQDSQHVEVPVFRVSLSEPQ